MQVFSPFRLALAMSAISMIAGGNAGMHLAVAPAISAYRSCIEADGADRNACVQTLHTDWTAQSGNRIPYAALGALAPLPIIWLGAFAFGSDGRRNARPLSLKASPARS
jgi:hypothetical protein